MVLDGKGITFRFARVRIGNNVSKPVWNRNMRCEYIDDLYKRVHIVDLAVPHGYLWSAQWRILMSRWFMCSQDRPW